jgi:hypothetical protein
VKTEKIVRGHLTLPLLPRHYAKEMKGHEKHEKTEIIIKL